MSRIYYAEIYRIDSASSAWLASIYPEDDIELHSSWRSEKAARDWVKRMLFKEYGIERSRLPWLNDAAPGFIKRLRLEWMSEYDDHDGVVIYVKRRGEGPYVQWD